MIGSRVGKRRHARAVQQPRRHTTTPAGDQRPEADTEPWSGPTPGGGSLQSASSCSGRRAGYGNSPHMRRVTAPLARNRRGSVVGAATQRAARNGTARGRRQSGNAPRRYLRSDLPTLWAASRRTLWRGRREHRASQMSPPNVWRAWGATDGPSFPGQLVRRQRSSPRAGNAATGQTQRGRVPAPASSAPCGRAVRCRSPAGGA
jgi:hypothetical protein